jgi:hypothetical protein
MKNSKRLIIYFSIISFHDIQTIDPFTISFLCLAVVGLGTSISSTIINHVEIKKQKDQSVLEDTAKILQKIQNTKKEAQDKERELLKIISNIKINIKKEEENKKEEEEEQTDTILAPKIINKNIKNINKNIKILEDELVNVQKELEIIQKKTQYTQEDLQNISDLAIRLFLQSELNHIITIQDFSNYQKWITKSQKKINVLFDKYNEKTKEFYKNFIIHVMNIQSKVTSLEKGSKLLYKKNFTKEELYQHIDFCLEKDKLTEEELYYILKYTKKYIEKEDNIVLLRKVLYITNIIYQNAIENTPRIYFVKQFEEKYGSIDDILKNIKFLVLLSFIGKIFDEHGYKHQHDNHTKVGQLEPIFFVSYKLLIDQKELMQIFEDMTIFKNFLQNFKENQNSIITLDKKMIDYIEYDLLKNISEKNINIYILYKIMNNENIHESIAILYILHLLKHIEIKKFKIPPQDLNNLNMVNANTLNALTKIQVMIR